MRTTPLRVLSGAALTLFAALSVAPVAGLGASAGPARTLWHAGGTTSYLPIRGATVTGDSPGAWAGASATSSLGTSHLTGFARIGVPGAPTITSAVAGNASATVSWSPPASNGGSAITSYELRDSTNGGGSWTLLSQLATSATSETVTGLTNGTGYLFEVQARNFKGWGNWSAPSATVTPVSTVSVPGAPTITSVTPGVNSVTVAWNAPSSNGGATITSYSVRYSSNGTTWTVATTSATASPYTVGSLTAGTAYVFEVAATNSAGTGAWSASSSPATPTSSATVPGAPTITSVVAGTASVTVSWNAPSSNGGATITSYSVRYSSNGGTSWTTATTSATASPYTVGSLTAGTAYVFEVAATNSVGTGAWSAPSSSVTPTGSTSNGIQYHGGPVMVNQIHVYEIWYGNWTTASTPKRQGVIDTFLHGIGGSAYFNTNTTYYDGSNIPVQNVVTVAGSTTANGSTSISQGTITSVVGNTLSAGTFPADPNGVYFVFTADNVTMSGFLTQFCGYHTYGTYGSTYIKYAFVGDPTGPSAYNCSAQTSSSPNGDAGGDAMVSVVAHELSESTTDPLLNAWYQDSTGEENGDLCAWNFGSYFVAANGTSYANVTWTINGLTYQYLIQQNWVNAGGGYCALKY